MATNTGWVPRHPETGGAGELLDMQGTSLPFAHTPAERQERGDPRPSIAELYRDRDDYLAKARAAAEDLAAAGYIVAEDVELPSWPSNATTSSAGRMCAALNHRGFSPVP